MAKPLPILTMNGLQETSCNPLSFEVSLDHVNGRASSQPSGHLRLRTEPEDLLVPISDQLLLFNRLACNTLRIPRLFLTLPTRGAALQGG